MGNEATELQAKNGMRLTATPADPNPLSDNEPLAKRIKLSHDNNQVEPSGANEMGDSSPATPVEAPKALQQGFSSSSLTCHPPTQNLPTMQSTSISVSATGVVAVTTVKTEPEVSGSAVVIASPERPASVGSSTTSLPQSGDAPPPSALPPPPPSVPLPLKSTTMSHLRNKYTGELEYMLREFRKLERQLLGAKGATQIEESAGSRERREKLHSFILHLEDTIRQIDLGCKLEAEGKSTVMVGVTNARVGATGQTSDAEASTEDAKKQPADEAALASLTQEKEEEENVQKLEEHILANLLPVKVRLKKQLAAQQGATRNPAGMPTTRRGMLQPSAAADGEKGTFVEAAEKHRKQAEAARLAAQERAEASSAHASGISDPTQFGKPLSGGGSSLTQKLHGATLGSNNRMHGHGVGASANPVSDGGVPKSERKILYAGMVPGSTQHHSGVAAATGVHKMEITDPMLIQNPSQSDAVKPDHPRSAPLSNINPVAPKPGKTLTAPKPLSASTSPKSPGAEKQPIDSATLTDEERRKLGKKRRKKKLLRLAKRRENERQRQVMLHQQAVQAAQMPSKGSSGRKKVAVGKGQGKKKGPRSVEYICALCSEAYGSNCDYNPWWALAQHECPKCRKTQVSTFR
jgi:hypothetical protein